MRLEKNPNNPHITLVLDDNEVDLFYEMVDSCAIGSNESGELASKIRDELGKVYKKR